MDSLARISATESFTSKLNEFGHTIAKLTALSLATCASVFAQDDASDTLDKEWHNAMLISHPYTTNLNPMINSVNLSVKNSQPVFETLTRVAKENAQPRRILWTVEVEPETKFFRLKNLKNGLYLSRIDGTNKVVLMNKPPREHLLSQWFVQSLTIEKDYAIVNRSGDQDYALNLNESFSAEQSGNVTPVSLKKISNEQSTAFMYRMNSRFLDATLYPLDIEKGTCLVFLPTGVPLESFTNPSPSHYFSDSVTRRYKISIKGSGPDIYSFIDGIGFDPLSDSLTVQQQSILTALRARVDNLKIVIENELDAEIVFQSFKEQLSDAYNSNTPISILYFPESYTQLTTDKADGKIEKEHIILDEQRLGMKVTIHQSLSASYSYGLLVKKSDNNGNEEIIIVDPTDTTKPTKPRF
ncbi:hypothetical protein [Pleionea sp. CnH1-48]|uniref:hypothetical protein n=1 Tax=Pleionea sp. CnH1-48 TaxID=2954494 RepID=UPI00209709EE|nr:hypothetical protein [Pleionea sp. CnH1-48]MCO7225588.1 hypothetical protein [Pleionea sp. CnH1-48]